MPETDKQMSVSEAGKVSANFTGARQTADFVPSGYPDCKRGLVE